MAEDAMDWHPTTPPAIHNPYSLPEYIPGGWPLSPPSYQHTTGVFARRRPPTFIERTAKRICMGLRALGTCAVLPAKPVYLIIRSLRNRRRERRNRDTIVPAPLMSPVSLPTYQSQADHTREHTQEQVVGQQTSHQIPTPPSTPPPDHLILVKDREGIAAQDYIQSPAATNVTNTETFLATPASVDQLAIQSSSDAGRTSTKRKRTASVGSDTQSEQYSTLEGYLASSARAHQQRSPEPDPPISQQKMRRANHFDAAHKRSPMAFGERGVSSRSTLKPIGSRIGDSKQSTGVWGPWQHEKPIELNPPGPAVSLEPPQQEPVLLGSEQENYLVELFVQKESLLETQTVTDQTTPDGVELSFDERWSTSQPMDVFYRDEDSETEENSTEDPVPLATAAAELSSRSYLSNIKRLFFRQESTVAPPPIRSRPMALSKDTQDDTPDQKQTSTTDSTNVLHQDHLAETVDGKLKEQSSNVEQLHVAPEKGKPNCKDASGLDSGTGKQTALVPKTPHKDAVKKLAKRELETPVTSTAQNVLETPENQLLKLKLGEDNDTPKATPHSGTKTTRLTRYREALEKAQRAKLEQYEIVELSKEWDKKVRHAVRHGIPDYLGPHDLARVAPQYGSYNQDNWLNDETINKYLELIAAHGRKNDRPDQVRSHHTFNNFFYNNLRSKGPESVTKWSKRAKIGGKNLAYVEKIFVPINSGAHWTLAVIEPTAKRITHYNSMRGTVTGARACEDLKNWVAVEQGKDFKEDEWTLIAVGESPQQANSDDCGVFTITSARQIMLGYTPMSYSPAQIPIQRIRIVAELINKGLLRSGNQE